MGTFLFTNQTLASNLASKPNVFHELSGHLNSETTWQTVLDYLTLSGSDGPGWTKEFTDGDAKAVYRPPEGVRPFIRFEWSADGNSRTIGMRLFESMSDVDTGVNQTPSSGQRSVYGLRNRRANETGATDWFLLADERGFIGGSIVNRDQANHEFKFGCWAATETVGADSADDYNFLIICTDNVSTVNGAPQHYPIPNYREFSSWSFILRDHKNEGASRQVWFQIAPYFDPLTGGWNTTLAGQQFGLKYPDPATGKLVMGNVSAMSFIEGESHKAWRGYVPGLFAHAHVYNVSMGLVADNRITLLEGADDFESRDFIVVPTFVTGNNDILESLILELSDWR
jgi:hypothetical protein